MKTAQDLALSDYKYFIVQENCHNAVGVISDSDDLVYFCNLSLHPNINQLTGQLEYILKARPETEVRSCANPEYKDKVQQGINRDMIDLIKDPTEVKRYLLACLYNSLPAVG